MNKGRLEAFSDGVIAILITIMVLELRAPQGGDWRAVSAMLPALLTYVLSFVYLAIYWNNHHVMFHAVHRVSGGVLWANLHLLFWLSLVPFVTGWMGENHFEAVPTAVYGAVLLMAAIAWTILAYTLIAVEGHESKLAEAMGADWKGKLSMLLYAAAIPLAFANQWISDALYVLVALMWFVPDRRITSRLDGRTAA